MNRNSWFSAAFLVAFSVLVTACGTSPTSTGDTIPLWARQPTRTIDNGYLVYVESDDDPSLDRSRFRAESAALNDLANECTMIPKGVRIEDRYEHKVGHLYQSYAKIGVEVAVCEEAKKAMTPERIRELANASMTEQVKRYQDQIGQTEAFLASNEAGDEDEGEEGTEAEAPAPVAPAQPTKTVVRDDVHFYVIREQIAFEKRDVILAPANSYQPSSPESQKFATLLNGQTQAVGTYQAQHPELKSASNAWSHYRHQIMKPKPPSDAKPLRPASATPRKPGAPRPPGKRRPKRRRDDLDGR